MNVDAHFKTWPFSVIPDRSQPLFWAGRKELRERVSSLLKSFNYKPQSTIDLVWASYGSGKTHLLFYLEKQAESLNNILPWYCVVPKAKSTFAEMYRGMLANFPFHAIPNDIAQVLQDNSQQNEVSKVLVSLLLGTPEQKALATDWLKGLRIDLRTSKKLLYVPYKIEKEFQMRSVFVQLISALTNAGIRIFLMLDEFQRIQSHQPFFEGVNTLVLDTFNANPRGFSVVFSCFAMQQRVATKLLLPELLDRFRGRQIFSLPEFTVQEALEFGLDLLNAFRPAGYSDDETAPFDNDAFRAAMEQIDATEGLSLIPRHIIQVLDSAFLKAIDKGSPNVEIAHIYEALSEIRALNEDGN